MKNNYLGINAENDNHHKSTLNNNGGSKVYTKWEHCMVTNYHTSIEEAIWVALKEIRIASHLNVDRLVID